MKHFFYLILFSFVLFSCSNENEEEKGWGIPDNMKVEAKPSKVINYEVLFDHDFFDNPKKAELLKELKICSSKNRGIDDYMNPACSPRFFELFPLSEKTKIENGFLLLTKSKTFGFPLRRIAVFVRERGTLVKVNEFVANIIGMQKNGQNNNDLILRFNDKDQGEDVFYNCVFKWDGLKYQYSSVEVIEGANWGGPVKQEMKDSISKEVLKDIIKNGMII